MQSENETVAEIVKRVRRDCNSYPLPAAADQMLKLAREIEAAHRREVAELRECLKEAVGEMCEYCKYQYSCDKSNCTNRTASKWRKALEGAKDEGK